MIEEATKTFTKNLPAGLEEVRSDLSKHFQASLERLLAEHNLVTREEFDAQTAVLHKTREKLDALLEKIQSLSNQA